MPGCSRGPGGPSRPPAQRIACGRSGAWTRSRCAGDELGHQREECRRFGGRRLTGDALPLRRVIVLGLGPGDEPAGAAERTIRAELAADALLTNLAGGGGALT